MKKLLMVIDFQNDFINGSLGTIEACNIVDNVVDKINNFDGDIIYTLDTHDENYFNILEGRALPIKHCIKNSNGWMVNDKALLALSCKKVLKVFEKNQFSSKEIFDFLCNNIYDSIEIIGLCTDICVLSNAVIARTAQLNTEIIVDAKCVAGVTVDAHEAALKVLKSIQVKVINE